MFNSIGKSPSRTASGTVRSVALATAALLALGLAGAPRALAQNTASISGIVTDGTGAVVPGATVTVTRDETGVATQVSTNEVGTYTAAALELGQYTIEVSTPGFKSFRSPGIVLNVRDRVNIDVALELGEVTETIEVTETAVQLQTESATVEEVVSGRQVDNIAMNGRNFMQLAALVPGASSTNNFGFNTPTGVGSGGAANISFNGMRRNHNVWRVDGQENYDRGCGGCVEVLPSIDAIQEFKVSTANAESDAGFGAGGQINIAVKSGTRDFHGTFYEFIRNDAFDANNFFANLNGRDKPKLRYNNFGYNIGGPVSFGGYNRDKSKTFFFWNHEWRMIRRDTLFNRNAPSAALRQGDFSAEDPITDPMSGEHFPNNQIPASRIDPNATILGEPGLLLPLPNTAEGTYIGVGGSPLDVHQEILRVDHNVNDKNRVMFRFIMDTNKQIFPTTQWANQSYPTIGTEFTNPPKKYLLQWTSTISPAVVNEMAVGFSRQPLTLQPTGNYERPSGLNVPELFPDNRANRVPNLLFRGALNTNINTGSWPWDNVLNTWQVRNNVLWARGNHTIRFGAEYMPFDKQQDLFGPTPGQFTFNRSGVGHEYGNFLLGRAFQYNEMELQTGPFYLTRSGGFWASDTWRVNSRLTLNLAIRYDMLPHSYEERDQIAAFFPHLFEPAQAPVVQDNGQILPDSGNLLNGIGIAGQNGIPRGLTDNHWALFTPRIGIAYRLTDDTVFRIGYGMFHERIQGNDIYNIGPNPPFSFTASIFDTQLSNPGGGAAARFPGGLRTYDGTYKIPQVQNWNAGIQHRYAGGIVVQASYIGTAASYLQTVRNINQPMAESAALVRSGQAIVNQVRPYLGWDQIRVYENSTNSSYHSLQASVRTEDWHGLTLQTSYTLSKAMDYTSGDVGGTKHQDSYNPRAEYGPSNFDRRHILLFSYVYDLPTPAGWSGALKALLGDWTLSGISAFQTGTPLNITISGDPHGIGQCVGCRPNASGDPNLASGQTRGRFFDIDAFSDVEPGVFGNSERNSVTRAGTNNFDISLFKNFPVSESVRAQFRAEAFNAFNHTQWTGYRTTYGGSGFGSVTSARDARVFQLALKFYW